MEYVDKLPIPKLSYFHFNLPQSYKFTCMLHADNPHFSTLLSLSSHDDIVPPSPALLNPLVQHLLCCPSKLLLNKPWSFSVALPSIPCSCPYSIGTTKPKTKFNLNHHYVMMPLGSNEINLTLLLLTMF